MNTKANHKIFNRMVAVFMALLCMMAIAVPSVMAASKKVANGTYTVPIELYKASENRKSMAAGAFKSTAKVKVSKGKMTMTVYNKKFEKSGITPKQLDLKVKFGNSWVKAKVVSKSKSGYPTALSFPVASRSTFLPCQLNPHVAAMGNQYVAARFKISWGSMHKA